MAPGFDQPCCDGEDDEAEEAKVLTATTQRAIFFSLRNSRSEERAASKERLGVGTRILKRTI